MTPGGSLNGKQELYWTPKHGKFRDKKVIQQMYELPNTMGKIYVVHPTSKPLQK